VIRLLPDHVANQIAAGEVVQRPASAVKELLENSVDAGAHHIVLVVKEAGRSLIQVTDDGQGMGPTDARLCFERHATSKIRQAEDLSAVRTKGFPRRGPGQHRGRGPGGAAHPPAEEELGTRILIEGSRVKLQEPVACAAGTTISVRNLFFNVPARRQFLKSDTGGTEARHRRVPARGPGPSRHRFQLLHNDAEDASAGHAGRGASHFRACASGWCTCSGGSTTSGWCPWKKPPTSCGWKGS
jgi:DNA mismatch repair protein MutL